MALSITQFPVGGYDDNFTYVVADTDTGSAVVVDPAGDIVRVCNAVAEAERVLTGVCITHTHFDHIEKVQAVRDRFDVPVYIHEQGNIPNAAQTLIGDGGFIPVGDGAIEALHTPGHTNDSVCYYIPAEQAADGVPKVLTGDTLFVEGCGRTTEQQVDTLYESLQRLAALPEETEVYPGHDYGSTPASTIAREKAHNKYLLVESKDAFRNLRLGK